jgi:predicted DNA-binding transcriptional regulator
VKKLAAVLTIAVLLISMPADVQAQGGNVLTWQRASALLRLNNNTIKDLAEAEQKSRKQYEDAVKESAKIDTKGRTIYILDQEIRIAFDDTTQMFMTQQKELFPEQMRYYWNMTQDSKRRTSNSLTISLRNMYLGLYSAHNDVRIKELKYEVAENLHNQNQLKLEKGMITEIEALESEYALEKARAELAAARRNRENMLRSFNHFLCRDIHTDYDDIRLESQLYTIFRDYDYYLGRALVNRAEIKQAEKQLALLEQKKRIMDRFPLSMNTVSVRKDYNNLLLDMEIQEARLEQAKLDIEVEVKEAYIEAAAAVKNTENMKKLLDLQKSNIDKIRRLYEKGLVSKTVLDQSEIGYLEFCSSYDLTLFDCNTKLMKLVYVSGIGMA